MIQTEKLQQLCFCDVKEKCGTNGVVALSWSEFLGGGYALMFLPNFLLVKKFILTFLQISSHAWQVMELVSNENNDVIYNDHPQQEVTRIRQIMEAASGGSETHDYEYRGQKCFTKVLLTVKIWLVS